MFNCPYWSLADDIIVRHLSLLRTDSEIDHAVLCNPDALKTKIGHLMSPNSVLLMFLVDALVLLGDRPEEVARRHDRPLEGFLHPANLAEMPSRDHGRDGKPDAAGERIVDIDPERLRFIGPPVVEVAVILSAIFRAGLDERV